MKAIDYPPITQPVQQAYIDYYAGPNGHAPKLTELGYAVRDLEPAVFERLRARLAETWGQEGHPHFAPEHVTPAESAQAALLDARWNPDQPPGDGPLPTWVNQSDGSYERLLMELLEMHRSWAGIPIRPAQFWGPRVYQRHAVLGRHVDIPTTHVVSSSITLAADLEEPWPLVLELDSGERVAVDLEPGQMLLYEGSRLPHYRPKPLAGQHYINLYLHYYPLDGRFDPERGVWVLDP